ncbi:tyrosine-type recombinase/integrase [Streptomyces sp. NPDC048275]|uniref:tyrosine-type recombinase/integrase n=1 Tax=Streptomyces sp. NPDC048275 TaxID=3155629 RepID=UPI0033CC6919
MLSSHLMSEVAQTADRLVVVGRGRLLAETTRRCPSGSRVRSRRVLWEPSRELGFHVLRHTYASVMLEAGESIVSLAMWLGHSDPAFTLRTYTHFMPQAGARGLSAIEAWFTDLG